MRRRMTFGSTFAGIGGFDLGFELAGMRCLWQIEKDAACRSVLALHWPDVPRLEDVREAGRHNVDDNAAAAGHLIAGTLTGSRDGGFRTEPGDHLVTAQGAATRPPGGRAMPAAPALVRRIMPLEAERLQGFEDEWTAAGSEGPQKDSPRYRQLGNAAPVPVAKWIAKQILREGGEP